MVGFVEPLRGGVATRDHPEQCLAALQWPSREHGPPFGGVRLTRRARASIAAQVGQVGRGELCATWRNGI